MLELQYPDVLQQYIGSLVIQLAEAQGALAQTREEIAQSHRRATETVEREA